MNSDFRELLSVLNDERVEYLIVGGYAVGKHTEPRYTKDLDIWIRCSQENAERVYKALAVFGAPLSGISVNDFHDPDVIYQIGVEPARIDIIVAIEVLDFEDCWTRRFESTFDGIKAVFISVNDLIRSKLAAARAQDLIDAQKLQKRIELESTINEKLPREDS